MKLQFMAWCQANLRGKDGYISGDREVNPFLIEPIYKKEFNRSLWAQGVRIYVLLALHDPAQFITYVVKRAWVLARAGFERGVVCNQPVGEKIGLSRYTCSVFAKIVFYLIPMVLVAGIGMALIKHKIDSDVAFAFGATSMTGGLIMLIGIASYISFDRLFYPGFLYGAISIPLAVLILTPWGNKRR